MPCKKQIVTVYKVGAACPPEAVCVFDPITNEVVDPTTLSQCDEVERDVKTGCAILTADVADIGVIGDIIEGATIVYVHTSDCDTGVTATTIDQILAPDGTDITASANNTVCPTYQVVTTTACVSGEKREDSEGAEGSEGEGKSAVITK